jgi:hypothetical protein
MREIIILVNLVASVTVFAVLIVVAVTLPGYAGKIDWSLLAGLGILLLWMCAAIVLLRRYQPIAWAVCLLGWAAVIVQALQPGIRMISLLKRARLGDRTAEIEPGVGIVLLCSFGFAFAAAAALVAVACLPHWRWGPSIPAQLGAAPNAGGGEAPPASVG